MGGSFCSFQLSVLIHYNLFGMSDIGVNLFGAFFQTTVHTLMYSSPISMYFISVPRALVNLQPLLPLNALFNKNPAVINSIITAR